MAIFTSIGNETFPRKNEAFPYAVGDRVAQIYFEEVLSISFDVVPELEESERGEGGFGSTGLK
jgi:dUTP pyrophosphatase